mmetsp:Transcript_49840/g.138448  ORF Transcript_49840/g.138448 Transcript_49840/m.138448 type:complete len:455 (+) Transcript_49840:361-1725(+)
MHQPSSAPLGHPRGPPHLAPTVHSRHRLLGPGPGDHRSRHHDVALGHDRPAGGCGLAVGSSQADLQRHHCRCDVRGPPWQDLRARAVLPARGDVPVDHDRGQYVQEDHLRAERLARGLRHHRRSRNGRRLHHWKVLAGTSSPRRSQGLVASRGAPLQCPLGDLRGDQGLVQVPLHPDLLRDDHAGHLRHDPVDGHGQHAALLPAQRHRRRQGLCPHGRAARRRRVRKPDGRVHCRLPGGQVWLPRPPVQRADHSGTRDSPDLAHLWRSARGIRQLWAVLRPDRGLRAPWLLGPVRHQLPDPLGHRACRGPQPRHGLGVRPGELHRQPSGAAHGDALGHQGLWLHLRRRRRGGRQGPGVRGGPGQGHAGHHLHPLVRDPCGVHAAALELPAGRQAPGRAEGEGPGAERVESGRRRQGRLRREEPGVGPSRSAGPSATEARRAGWTDILHPSWQNR